MAERRGRSRLRAPRGDPARGATWHDVRLLAQLGPLLVTDKPAGLRSTAHGPSDTACAEARVAAAHGRRVWALHQLDQNTSGLLLFVDKRAAVSAFQRVMGPPRSYKRYLALVHGAVENAQVLRAPLRVDRAHKRTVVHPDGKAALSRVRPVAQAADRAFTLVEVRLDTGRTHQVRAHMAHAGHPLVGDARYGGAAGPGAAAHHALHAWRLDLTWPAGLPRPARTEEHGRVTLEAQPPAWLNAQCAACGIHWPNAD